MKLKTSLNITLSNDNIPMPIQVRFHEEVVDIDIASFAKSITREDNFAIGDHVIDLGAITAGKFIYLKSTQDVALDLDGQSITFKANKPNLLYTADFSILTLTLAVAAEIVLCVAGS